VSVLIFRSLASSSAGNAYLVSGSNDIILLECGIPFKKLEEKSGYSLSRVCACFITHEHKDHCRAAPQLLRHGVRVYASEGTARALGLGNIEIIEPWEPIDVAHFRVMAVPVLHDAAQPAAFLIDDNRTKERLFFAADTRGLNYIISRPTYIAVECNYEESILETSLKMPDSLKERIRHSHFEVNGVLKWLKKQDLSGVITIWLLHLSDANSNAEKWLDMFRKELSGIDIRVCQK